MSIQYACLNKNVIQICQGSDYTDTVTVQNGDGTPMDLTGCTVRSQLRHASGNSANDFVCTVPAPLTGIINRSLPKSATSGLVPALIPTYVWGVEITSAGNVTMPEIQGGATITAEVVK